MCRVLHGLGVLLGARFRFIPRLHDLNLVFETKQGKQGLAVQSEGPRFRRVGPRFRSVG